MSSLSPCMLDFLNIKEKKRVGNAKAQTTINSIIVYLPIVSLVLDAI
jgi:hypothetical protein